MVSEKWKHKQLGQLLKLRGGYAFKSEDFHEHGDVAVLRISNIKNNGIDLEDAVYVDRNVAEQAKDYKLREGNVVIAMSGATTGKTAIVRKEDLPLVLNQRVGVFDIYNSEHLSEEYLAYVVQSSSFKNQILVNAIGGAQPNISGKQIEDVEILLPPISEQRKIAAILSSVDGAIEKIEAIIEQTEKVKKGLMQQLLTKGIGHTKFKRTEIGEIPEEWEVKTIGEIGSLKSGTTPSREKAELYYKGGEIPWVKTMDLNYSFIVDTHEKVTNLALEETSLSIIPKGSVLVAMYGGFNQIGRTGLLKIDATINQALTAILINTELIEPEFLLIWLNYKVNHWKKFAASSRKDPNITKNDVANFPVVIPSLEEQRKIYTTILNISKKIENEIIKKQQLQIIKKGLMQVLLTGKVRVKVDDEVMSQ
jgi:type I restriction enzyme, S subunit